MYKINIKEEIIMLGYLISLGHLEPTNDGTDTFEALDDMFVMPLNSATNKVLSYITTKITTWTNNEHELYYVDLLEYKNYCFEINTNDAIRIAAWFDEILCEYRKLMAKLDEGTKIVLYIERGELNYEKH